MTVWPAKTRRAAFWRHRGFLLSLASAGFAVVLLVSLLGLVGPGL